MAIIKTGEVFYRDIDDNLFFAESFLDEDTGVVHTEVSFVPEPPFYPPDDVQ